MKCRFVSTVWGHVTECWFLPLGILTLSLVVMFLSSSSALAVNSVRIECPITKPVVDGDSDSDQGIHY